MIYIKYKFINNMLKSKRGYSVIEVLLSGVIFSLAVASVVSIIIYTQRTRQISLEKDLALSMLEEGSSAIKSIRDNNFYDLTAGNGKALSLQNGAWSIIDSPLPTDDSQGKRVRRLDIINDILSPDEKKKVTIYVTYPVNAKGDTRQVSITEDIVNIKKESLIDVTMQSENLNMVLDSFDIEENFNLMP